MYCVQRYTAHTCCEKNSSHIYFSMTDPVFDLKGVLVTIFVDFLVFFAFTIIMILLSAHPFVLFCSKTTRWYNFFVQICDFVIVSLNSFSPPNQTEVNIIAMKSSQNALVLSLHIRPKGWGDCWMSYVLAVYFCACDLLES